MIARPHELRPEQFLHFVELDEFRADWEQLGLDVDDDLLALQMLLMHEPGAGAVIPGTGGLRKLRFSPSEWSKGKSASVRVCYVWWPAYWLVLLVMAYHKSVKTDLAPEEKTGIRLYLQRIERWLANRPKRTGR
jgi:hypothetical protein